MPNPTPKAIGSPHDRLFRYAFSDPEVAIPEMKAVLPKSIERFLALDQLAVEPGSFVSPALRTRYADMMYRVPIVDESEPAFIWSLLEHQSTSQALMAFRLLEYQVQAWSKRLRENRKLRTLPLIVPVVLSHDPRGWTAHRELTDLYDAPDALKPLLRPNLTQLRYIVDDLSQCSEKDLAARSPSPYARLVLWTLRNRGKIDAPHPPYWTEEFNKMWKEEKRDAMDALLRYHSEMSTEDMPGAFRAAAEGSPELKEYVMSFAERLRLEGEERGRIKGREEGRNEGRVEGRSKGRAEGRVEGRAEGRVEGRSEGRAETLIQLLELKFPAQVSDAAKAQVRAAPEATLSRWTARVLTAESVAIVLDEPDD